MTKDEVKTLCEADPQLCWWAMVLFAEICDQETLSRSGWGANELYPQVQYKVKEFDRLVIQRSMEKAKGKPDLESRVEALEKAVFKENE